MFTWSISFCVPVARSGYAHANDTFQIHIHGAIFMTAHIVESHGIPVLTKMRRQEVER